MSFVGRTALGLLLVLCCGLAQAQLRREIFVPASLPAPVAVVISGIDSLSAYRPFARHLARSGYYTVLAAGWDLSAGLRLSGAEYGQSVADLRSLVSAARAAAGAPSDGKVALIGFSMGGLAALRLSGTLANDLSAVVAFYPAVGLVGPDMTALVRQLPVPTLVFAGGRDSYLDCCLLDTMRLLDATARAQGKPLDLVVYPEAGHGFDLRAYRWAYHPQAAEDAWRRAIDFLKRHRGRN